MYVVDITRKGNETDMICGIDSMEAKRKTINYIIDYAFANYNINIDKDVLDENLNMELFCLKDFLKQNYHKEIDEDLIVQSFPINKDFCLFVKHIDRNIDTIPLIYAIKKDNPKLAEAIKEFLINDSLIKKYENNLHLYEQLKEIEKRDNKFVHENISSEIISFYNKEMFMEELLNNSYSLLQLRYKDLEGYIHK